MRARSIIAVLGLVVGAVACGSNGTTTSTTVPTPTTSATATTMTAAQLEAKLLTVADVGASWQASNAINAEDLASFANVPCPDAAINPTIVARLTGRTGVQFEPVDHSYKHLIEMVVTGDPARLDADLKILFEAIEACPTVASTTTATTGTGPVSVAPLTIPALGDQRAAYGIKAVVAADSIWYTRTATVRIGDTAVGLGLTEVLASAQTAPQIDDATFVQLLQTAVARFSA